VRIDILLHYQANDLSATTLLYVRIDLLLQYEANDLSATLHIVVKGQSSHIEELWLTNH
jgi:hypothetical protein